METAVTRFRHPSPTGGDRTKGISLATLGFDVSFLTYASIDYESWSVTNGNCFCF
jgi:hypothetical protein